jgi:hypothetical protein
MAEDHVDPLALRHQASPATALATVTGLIDSKSVATDIG